MSLHSRLITLYSVRSKSLKIGRCSHSKKQKVMNSGKLKSWNGRIWGYPISSKPGSCSSNSSSHDGTKRCGCMTLHNPNIKLETTIVTEVWTGPRKAHNQLECKRQVCWTAELWEGGNKHSRSKGSWAYWWGKGSSENDLARFKGDAADQNVHEWGIRKMQNNKRTLFRPLWQI